MPGSWTDQIDNAILDFWFGGKPLIPPSLFWFGLSTRRASKDGTISEPPASAGYGRMGVSNQPMVWLTLTPTSRSNALAINFPKPTGEWGLIISGFLADDQHGGKVWASFDFDTPKLVQPPQPGPVIAKGAWVVG